MNCALLTILEIPGTARWNDPFVCVCVCVCMFVFIFQFEILLHVWIIQAMHSPHIANIQDTSAHT